MLAATRFNVAAPRRIKNSEVLTIFVDFLNWIRWDLVKRDDEGWYSAEKHTNASNIYSFQVSS